MRDQLGEGALRAAYTSDKSKWDIVVTAAEKTGGIRTELFTVKPHTVPSTCSCRSPHPASAYEAMGRKAMERSRTTNTGYAVLPAGYWLVVRVMQPFKRIIRPGRPAAARAEQCLSFIRPVTLAYIGGGTETMLVFLNLLCISNETTSIAIGYSSRVEHPLSLNPTQKERCDAWRWTTNSTYAGDKVWVERVSVTRFHVYTKHRDPDPALALANAQNNRAVCTTTMQAHRLSVDLYIEASGPVR